MTGPRIVLPLVVMLAATGSLVLVGVVLMAMNWPASLVHAEWGFPGFQGAGAIGFAAIGVPIVWRRPRNFVGWLFMLGGLLSALQFAGHQYALYGLVAAPGRVPEPWVGTWIEGWIWVPIMGVLVVFPFLLYPTGRLLSPRWRAVAAAAIVGAVLATVGLMFSPLSRVPRAVNPWAETDPPGFAVVALALGMVLIIPAFVLSLLALVMRFGRSSGVERQQLKWLLFGALLTGIGIGLYILSTVLTGDVYVGSPILAILLFAVPVTMAVAMLRHGLYEVDRLLSRTATYTVVSLILAVLYAGTVLVLQPLFHPVTGGDTLAVTASTLLVVTLFRPVHERVKVAVDRRFFRSRYDAQRSVERLRRRLRKEVDLETLRQAVLGEVVETVRPASAVMWLRARS